VTRPTRRLARMAGIAGVLLLLVAAAIVGIRGWTKRLSRPVASIAAEAPVEIIVATGRVEPFIEVALANKIPGRIKAVLVRQGDLVEVGQPLILFDDEENRTHFVLVQRRVATAEAEVTQARRALGVSQAQWVEIKSGSRPEEIERARAEVEQARQRAKNTEIERQRAKELSVRGSGSVSEYDAAETEAGVAQAKLRVTEETLKLVLAGSKPESVASARARVLEAAAGLTRAESRVAEAKAELDHAKAVLKTTVVESSVKGKVIRKMVEPGEAVDIGIPLMILGDLQKIIVRAEVDETDVAKLALGQAAQITVDAYPGRVFPGTVIEIGQAVGKRKTRPEDPVKIQDMKVLETKIEVTKGGGDLKLGMTVDVRITPNR
jgi:ABC exporter DevB family membrane fusion protein